MYWTNINEADSENERHFVRLAAKDKIILKTNQSDLAEVRVKLCVPV